MEAKNEYVTPSSHGLSAAASQRREELAKAIVDAIYEDLRDRKLLKLLWDKDGRNAGMVAREVYPLDEDVQAEIHQQWVSIVVAALNEPRGLSAAEGASPERVDNKEASNE